MSIQVGWWEVLNHGGLLIAPNKIFEAFETPIEPISYSRAERLRREITRFDGTSDTLSSFLDFLLEDLSGLPSNEWQKGQHVDKKWSVVSFTNEPIKPRRIWIGPNGETFPLFVPQPGSGNAFGSRLGVGRSRRFLSRVLEWLRRQQQPLALITNGRQIRLVHAGQDYDAWCEWDIDLWFEEGIPGNQVLAWRHLVNREVLISPDGKTSGVLLKAILDSRKGQADLSSVLGERVRQAVELLISASHGRIEEFRGNGLLIGNNDLYIAGTKIIMRCIIALFAEARGLLPADNRIYQQAYSIDGLRQLLDRRSGGRVGERLAQGNSAWPRLIALFNLIYYGSSHEALTVTAYSGNLFKPGDLTSDDRVSVALAILENPSNQINDKQVRQLLRFLTRTTIKVRKGRGSTNVDGPVDFSALSTEYIGILYEGLLDYELKQAEDGDPIIFLSLGRQPALPLSRLESMDDKAIKQLFEEMKKKEKGPAIGDESGGDADGDDEPSVDELDSGHDESESELADEVLEDIDNDSETGEEELGLTATDMERAAAWLERAAVVAGMVKQPRGRSQAQAYEEFEKQKREAGESLCARLIAPGEFYLVRWGGTRKGAGTFYTRPQLASPTVRRTLQPLAYEPVRSELNPRTGLEEVVEWTPRKPETILSLKVCDPTMGSGSFLVSALRFLTDALVQSLFDHNRIERRDNGAVARLADGHELSKDTEQPIPLPPDHEGFEDKLRAQLKRHIVERCIYGADIDPLAVELGRMALWVETMDRTLPFGFLDHKLKVGNTVLGAWFDTFREYPAMAWERDGGDKDYRKDKPDQLINHFYIDSKGKKRGDVFTAAIKSQKSEVQRQLILRLSGQLSLGENAVDVQVHEELTRVFEEMHTLPVHETEKRASLYQEKVLHNYRYQEIKDRMDLWCALWFWPGESIHSAPMPSEFANPSEEVKSITRQIAVKQKFFHWELEFPDVFTLERRGFDACIGNPPWEIQKPNSKEFFSNIDPLYRVYGKQDALVKQGEYFLFNPEHESSWLQYCATLKAQSNWVKFSGVPFGDDIKYDSNGRKKHDFNLGGRGGNSFEASEALHERWHSGRKYHKCYADKNHPFLHQGSADINTYKMFLEQSHALLRDAGRLGMIVPSGIYTDKGTTALRELFLGECDWQWLFGFENRDGIFDIHRSFKFCPLVIKKGGSTKAIRAAFMHRDLDDWEQAERYVLAYPRERVEEFSPYSKAILEIRSERDLKVLQKIYANGVLLGDKSERGWGIKYATEFHMTNDSRLFPERPKWEAKGYQPDEYGHWLKGSWREYTGPANILDRQHGLILSRDCNKAMHVEQIEDVALPLYEGRMIGQFDFSEKGWVSGKGRSAVWRDIPFEPFDQKVIEPQYLTSAQAVASSSKCYMHPKIAYMRIGSATNSRTAISSYLNVFPAGDSVFFYRSNNNSYVTSVSVSANLNALVYDFHLRNRVGGLNLSEFIMDETSLISSIAIVSCHDLLTIVAALTLVSPEHSVTWMGLMNELPELRNHFQKKSWSRQKAISKYERLRLRVILDALYAVLYKIDIDELCYLLKGCDMPANMINNAYNTSEIDPKGFWRLEKNQHPESRHTVLSLIAYNDLLEKGLEAFLGQNDGEGWMIPEKLRLADYGLGHDDRAKEHQPVAALLGPRFYDWQLNEDIARSWEECEAHAELIRKIVPIQQESDEADEADTSSAQNGESRQINLF